jgi:5-methylthioadenosine/S-adenosylhomocysteine deaminase
MSPEFVRDASELACLEMLKAGVTAFCDMYFFQDVTAEVATRIGMRATLGAGVIDFPTSTTSGPDDCIAKAEKFIEKWRGHSLIVPSIAAHSPLTCSAATLTKVRDLAARLGTPMQIHMSETEAEAAEMEKAFGMRPAHYLDSIGFLGERLLASHCVWVDEDEIDLLAARGVSVAHCPESNLKLASGIAPAARMLRAGVRLAVGTDGAASNNDLDVLGELRTASLLAKARASDATALDARASLRMATASGARAIGFAEAGTLTPGALADIVVIDLDKPHLTPLYDIHSQIAYAARAADVETVMVGGRVLVERGRAISVDEDEIIAKARAWAERIASWSTSHGA